MSGYPGSYDTFRTTQNLPGILYDALDVKTVYAEDTNYHSDSIVAVQHELGLNPSGAAATVVSRLDGVDTALAGKEPTLGFTAENVANKATSTSLGASNTLYPSQGAVKSYVDTGLATKENSLGFTAENVSNKSTTTSLGTSNTLYPSQNAVKTYVDTVAATKQNSLGFTAENVSNKSTTTSLGTSNTLYPTQNAVKSYVDTVAATKQNSLGFTAEDVANKSTSTSLGSSNMLYPSQNAVKAYVDAAILATKQALYPVGSIWTSTSVSTSPATVLGFGTWSVFSTGRVLVSKAASGTFGTIGSTGGAETVTLALTDIPSHNHSTVGTWPSQYATIKTGSGGGGIHMWANSTVGGDGSIWNSTFNHEHQYQGGGGAHNNLQPYVVVYMWERTA